MSGLSFNFWNKPQGAAAADAVVARGDMAAPLVPSTGEGCITSIEQVPPWTRVRTAPGGDIPVSSSDRSKLAVLEREDSGVTILYVRTSGWEHALTGVEGRLKEAKISRIVRLEALQEIIEIVYETDRAERGSISSGESEQGKLFNSLLEQAVLAKASDIHLQAGRNVSRVLLRVNGDLGPIKSLSGPAGERLGRAIFALAEAGTKGVDFNPNQFQDAKLSREIYVNGEKVQLQLRFAVMPTYPEGFDVTLRVLQSGTSSKTLSLERLGYDAAQVAAIHRMLGRPEGAVVLCGPTGSGKSTTLAACCAILHGRYEGRRLIRTIEDPPEYYIPGARQTPVVRSADGRSDGFGMALRGAMRSDPDILLIGEVRDEDTGVLAMEAVTTGHKVLTTVHAASPFDAIDRLVRKGFERSIIAADDIISGAVYQRLIPVLCPDCAISFTAAEKAQPHDHVVRIRKYFPGDLTRARYRGPGCDSCRHTGIVGRTVAASMLLPDRDVRAHILADDRVTAQAYWRSHPWSGGYEVNGRTALDQGIQKMAEGLVSPADVEHELGDLDSQESRESTGEWLGRQRQHLRAVQ